MSELKKVSLSIGEFALPCPRTGSIDVHSGFGNSALQGIEIHQLVQKKRAKEDSKYQSEVPIEHEFERGGFLFSIQGRIDGLFAHDVPKIEEIKSSSQIYALLTVLKERQHHHPYYLQLLTYGYFYHLEHGENPELSFHLVSTRKKETLDYSVRFDRKIYDAWLELRFEELVKDAELAEKRTARRKKISSSFAFPFEIPRSGQIELIESIDLGMSEDRRQLLQAPTGLGKTVGVLYPTLKEALSRGQRVVYVTPKNSQHSVAEDAIERFQDKGAALKSLTITAKSKMCFKAEPLCNPTYCEYAKDYYDKLAQNELIDTLRKKKKLTARVFKKVGEEFQVCPFELQLDAAQEADTIICDYNYVFAPQSALGRLPQTSFCQTGKPNLVIDEAHNLPSRTMSYYSPSVSIFTLEKIRNDLQYLPSQVKKEANALALDCILLIRENCPEEAKRGGEIELDADPFLEIDSRLRAYLSNYLDSDIEIRPKDPVLRLCFYWGAFAETLQQIEGQNRPEFFSSFQPDGTLKITCCDASEMLKPCYDEYDQVVGFSATLKPFDYYAKFMGLEGESLKTAEFSSPFEKTNRKLLIIPQVSTKYSERERNYERIAETVSRITSLKPGNYFVFFPSFDFLERVMALVHAPLGFQMIRQNRNSNADDIEYVLEKLKTGDPHLVFAVQGGVFSEGVDYPGDMIIGAFVVGPPLPNFDVEREGMKKYYEEYFKKGFDYAYAYPAMAKAVQAAGRVIRSSTDRGVIILMDGRFLESSYSQSMPADWFHETPKELVSQSILKEIGDFWNLKL